MIYPIGMFDPHHKAKNDAALAQVVLRKFVGDAGMDNIVVGEVRKMLDDFEKNHKEQVLVKTKLSFKKLFVFSDWHGGVTDDVLNLYERVKQLGWFGDVRKFKLELEKKYETAVAEVEGEGEDEGEDDEDEDEDEKGKKEKKNKTPPVPEKAIKQVAVDAVHSAIKNVLQPAMGSMMKGRDAKDLVEKSVKDLRPGCRQGHPGYEQGRQPGSAATCRCGCRPQRKKHAGERR